MRGFAIPPACQGNAPTSTLLVSSTGAVYDVLSTYRVTTLERSGGLIYSTLPSSPSAAKPKVDPVRYVVVTDTVSASRTSLSGRTGVRREQHLGHDRSAVQRDIADSKPADAREVLGVPRHKSQLVFNGRGCDQGIGSSRNSNSRAIRPAVSCRTVNSGAREEGPAVRPSGSSLYFPLESSA